VRPLARDEIVFICSPAHPWAARGEVTLEELMAEPLIVQQQGAGIRSVMEQTLRERGIKPGDFNVILEMGLNESVKHAVMAGAGVTYLSKFAVRSELENGTVAAVRVPELVILRDFYFVHSRNRVLSKAVAAFLEFLGEQYERL